MIESLAAALTQRALDHRQPTPRVVRFITAWHAPSRCAVDDLLRVDRALTAGVADEYAAADPSPVLASRPNPAWWAQRSIWGTGAAAAAALLALAWWFGAFSTGVINPTGQRFAQQNDTSIVAPSPTPTKEPVTLVVAWPDNFQRWQTAWTQWQPPRPAGLNEALDDALDPAAVSQGVRQLGVQLEAPLRDEWARLVADVSSVLQTLDPDPSRATPPDASPDRQSQTPGRPAATA